MFTLKQNEKKTKSSKILEEMLTDSHGFNPKEGHFLNKIEKNMEIKPDMLEDLKKIKIHFRGSSKALVIKVYWIEKITFVPNKQPK